MELIVKEVVIPEKIEFNYAELKSEIETKLEVYKNLVYEEKDLKLAKADKSSLNKLKKALNDERIRREKEYMKPFNDFKNQINEIIDIIDEPVKLIDSQIKDYEQVKKEKKQKQIYELFNEKNEFDWLDINKIYNPKWLNSSFAMKKVQDEIDLSLAKIKNDFVTIENMEDSFEIKELYKKSLDFNYAIAETQRLKDLQKRKQAEMQKLAELRKQKEMQRLQEAKKQESTVTIKNEIKNEKNQTSDFIEQSQQSQSRQWLSFTALLNVEDALKLKEFFVKNKIEFKPLER